VNSFDLAAAQDAAPQPRAPHYGDPLGEQRRLENGETASIGQWAREAVRIGRGILGADDVAAPGETMVFLHLDGSDNALPVAGDQVFPLVSEPAACFPQMAVNSLGRITSAANHYELGPIAFAAVTAATDDGTRLKVVTNDNGRDIQIAAIAQWLPK